MKTFKTILFHIITIFFIYLCFLYVTFESNVINYDIDTRISFCIMQICGNTITFIFNYAINYLK